MTRYKCCYWSLFMIVLSDVFVCINDQCSSAAVEELLCPLVSRNKSICCTYVVVDVLVCGQPRWKTSSTWQWITKGSGEEDFFRNDLIMADTWTWCHVSSSSSQGADGEADLDMIKTLIEDTLFSTQPAMVLNLKTCVSSPVVRHIHSYFPLSG